MTSARRPRSSAPTSRRCSRSRRGRSGPRRGAWRPRRSCTRSRSACTRPPGPSTAASGSPRATGSCSSPCTSARRCARSGGGGCSASSSGSRTAVPRHRAPRPARAPLREVAAGSRCSRPRVLVVGLVPYLALQLKTLSRRSALVAGGGGDLAYPRVRAGVGPAARRRSSSCSRSRFGLRRVRPTERHPGLMVALAVESVVKLVAFLAAGALRDVGPLRAASGTCFRRAAAAPAPARRRSLGGHGVVTWLLHLLALRRRGRPPAAPVPRRRGRELRRAPRQHRDVALPRLPARVSTSSSCRSRSAGSSSASPPRRRTRSSCRCRSRAAGTRSRGSCSSAASRRGPGW